MESLSLKKLSHVDGQFRLIPKFSKPLEDTVIAVIKTKNEIKNVLHNTIREFMIILDEIRLKLWNDNFILKMKDKIKVKNRKVNESNAFSLCDGVLM